MDVGIDGFFSRNIVLFLVLLKQVAVLYFLLKLPMVLVRMSLRQVVVLCG